MSFASGARLGHYDIVSPLGEGGMGEVYRAHDSRLGRDVAIKVLPQLFLADPERLQRFEQEARATAALNHPNILAVFDIGQHESGPFIVSELLEGETLRARIDAGPIAVRRAIEYAVQIARGLGAAHEKGIVHRDLKPENLFVTPDNRIKILDFGLAKPIAAAVPSGVTGVPTIAPVTDAGVVLGTVGYMAPEQVRGLPADHRADIFALGAVLYEMLSGRRAFRGDTPADTMTAILKEEPPPPIAPSGEQIAPGLMRVIERCLDKSPAARFQSASDLAFALESLSTLSGATGAVAPVVAAKRSAIWGWAAAGAAALALVATVPFALAHWREAPPSVPSIRFDLAPPVGVVFTGGPGFSPAPAISPDGRFVVFMAARGREQSMLWLRSLDQTTMRPLNGTEGGAFPFWSADSASVAFFTGDKLKRIDIAAGAVQTICDVAAGEGGSWSRDGIIVFAPNGNSGLSRVPASGGVPEPATTLAEAERSHRWPQFLPDGRRFLYISNPGGQLHAGSIDTRESGPPILPARSSKAVYVAPGYLLYVRESTLLAHPFDAATLKATGEPLLLAEDVRAGGGNARAAFSVSDSGVLVYRTGAPPTRELEIQWFDRRSGKFDTVGHGTDDYRSVTLAPDDGRAMVHRHQEPLGGGLWLMDLVRGTTSRFGYGDEHETRAVWSPDGTHVAYDSVVSQGVSALFQNVPGGTGKPELLFKGPDGAIVTSWSADTIVYSTTGRAGSTGTDIWALPLTGTRQPRPVVQTKYDDFDGTLSPDGRWLAYVSNETGLNEVYVQPFPSGGAKSTISTSGGVQPAWRHDGGELFYLTDRGGYSSRNPAVVPGDVSRGTSVMSVEIRVANADFSASSPKVVFESELLNRMPLRAPGTLAATGQTYSVSRDGQRFLLLQRSAARDPDDENTPLTVIVNWTAVLPRR